MVRALLVPLAVTASTVEEAMALQVVAASLLLMIIGAMRLATSGFVSLARLAANTLPFLDRTRYVADSSGCGEGKA